MDFLLESLYLFIGKGQPSHARTMSCSHPGLLLFEIKDFVLSSLYRRESNREGSYEGLLDSQSMMFTIVYKYILAV